MSHQVSTGPAKREVSSGPATPYSAPVVELLLALKVAGLDQLLALDDFAHVDSDAISSVLEEFGRLANGVLASSDRVGDVIGAQYDPATGTITTPDEFHRAFSHFVDGGWSALAHPREFGGGELPTVVSLALQEMFASANMALSLNPVLTQGAIEALLQWGNDQQKDIYLARLLTSEWSGTMNLTEPDAGSDLNEIRAMAHQADDGTWRVSGTKIFITWGEHDLAQNIIHLVLARTPDGPPGTKGLSLFVVPKFLVNPDGTLGERNTFRAIGMEHKLGIHGSSTCVMQFDDATGELVGPRHGGMRAMFTMMNAARLSIGVQGPAVGERAFQHAFEYASGRLQGRTGNVKPPERSPLVDHPDVQRMLLLMSTMTRASRLLLFLAGGQKDHAMHLEPGPARERAQQMVDLLTPVAKAWSTDRGVDSSSLGIQVLGGAGFIEEYGMAQRLRDVRIAPIYEGTNGIQAIDLVFRKLPRDGGKWVRLLMDEVEESLAKSGGVDLSTATSVVSEAIMHLRDSTEWMLKTVESAPDDALAGATNYLELFGSAIGGWLMIERARLASAEGHSDAERIALESDFFAVDVVARSSGLVRSITAGAHRLAAHAPQG